MAGDSVGQIGLDLVVNKNNFEKQMSGIQGTAKKAGLALAAAFAVKKIVDFGAQCIQLGSDLAEVQNVVDVTFPRMARQVDSFAQNAAASFGLSETMAKRFTGTFGAMAKAFNFNEKAAYDMSTTLTGLSGDVASFYNISQDEAFTKLKAVFTGETEALKDLGIVMTQAALDQYALANGYGKTTQAMTEGEKVALRYKFVTDQLSLASGDFVRTSGGWANQVRLLKLQFDSLKATIGQGLIAVLTPVIKVINSIIGKILSLANAFKAFAGLISGKKGSGGGASVASAGMDAVAESADSANAAMDGAGGAAKGAGGAAKKAAKDIKGAATGIDELNIVNAPDESGGSGGGGSGSGGGGGGYASDEFDMGEMDMSPVDEMDSRYQALIDRFMELSKLFTAGFKLGLGDMSVLDSIQGSIKNISKSLKDIFTDPSVVTAANTFLDLFVYNLGKVAGSVVSIGLAIADNLVGGFSLYLEQNSGIIKDYLIYMFDIGSDLSTIIGDFSVAAADIFSVFRSSDAKQITADIIGIFSSAFFGVTELIGRFAVDVVDLITLPFIENKDLIKTTLEDTFSAVEPVFAEIKLIVDEVFAALKFAYDTYVAPMFESFKNGFSEIAKKALEAYNQHILPVIQGIGDKFTELREGSLRLLIDKFLEFVDKVTEAITTVWEKILMPFAMWFIEKMGPIIGDVIKNVVDIFFNFWNHLNEIVGYVLDALGGLIDFILGVFTGDWKRAWEGLKTFLSSTWSAMKTIVFTVFSAIKDFVWTCLSALKSVWDIAWQAIRDFLGKIWDGISATVNSIFTAIGVFISAKINDIRSVWNTAWQAIKDFFSNIWNGISSTVSTVFGGVCTFVIDTIDKIRSGLEEKLSAIKAKWDEIWDGVKSKASEVWDGIKGIVTGSVDAIIAGVEGLVNGVIKGINWLIQQINKISIDVPETPFTDGFSIGFDIPQIQGIKLQRLAQGGYVEANTPQLAMIGDNRHYGEIVAPEDKMQEMVDRAVAMASAGGGMSDQYLAVMVDLLKQIVNLIESMDLTVTIDIREIKKKLVELDKRTGYTLKTT